MTDHELELRLGRVARALDAMRRCVDPALLRARRRAAGLARLSSRVAVAARSRA